MSQAKPTPTPITEMQWPAIYRAWTKNDLGELNYPAPNWQVRAITEANWRNTYHSDRRRGGCNSDPAQLAQMMLRNFNSYSRLGTPRAIDCANLAAALIATLHEGHNSPGTDCPGMTERAEITLLNLSGYPPRYRLKWRARSTTWARRREAERDTDRANLAAALHAMFREGQAAAQAEMPWRACRTLPSLVE